VRNVAVIDASLAAMWGMQEFYTNRALALADHWAQDSVQPIAPCLILAELTNAFYRRVVRGEADLSTAIAALKVVLAFGIEIHEEPGIHSLVMKLSHQLKRPNTYDCQYLALAETYHCPLWTGDERFYNSVIKTFPRVRWIGNYQTISNT
jgi:predicted nucleic acid-binding protein